MSVGERQLQQGDVICVKGDSWVSRAIGLGAAMLNKPNTVSHVAIYMGLGNDGKPRVIEARPGGVGWKDADKYLKDNWTIDNRDQPKTTVQREQICEATLALLGTKYDWVGIGQNVMEAIRAPDLYRSAAWAHQASPDEVVCSSMADWIYAHVGLANPGKTLKGDKITTPGDWAEFIVTKGWEK